MAHKQKLTKCISKAGRDANWGYCSMLTNISDSMPTMLAQRHRRDIQGLRAIAVLAVICFHAGLPISGGFAGVDVFFVISGFVITLMLSRDWQGHGKIDLARFYFNRFKRLMPALSLVVTVTIALSVMFLSPLGTAARIGASTGIAALLMTANVVIAAKTGGYFDTAAADNPLLHTWSLSVEEQFYILFPFILLVTFLIGRRNKALRLMPLFTVCLLGIISVVAMSLPAFGPLSPKMALFVGFYSPVSRAWEFAAGAILALVGTGFMPRSRITANVFATLGAALIGLSFFLISGKNSYPGPLTFLPVLGTTAVIYAGASQNHIPFVTRLLGSRPMAGIGDISYSWYLWHWPAIVFASIIINDHPLTLTIAGVVSLFPAFLSYRWVENPLRQRNAAITTPKTIKFVTLTILPVLAVCSMVVFVGINGYWSNNIKEFQRSVDPLHAGTVAGCGQGLVPASPTDSTCLWNANATGTPIYLIGDSNADQFSEAVINAGEKIGSPVKIFSKGGCSFLGRSWTDRSELQQTVCLKFVDDAMALIRFSKPGIVIFGISDSIWKLSDVAVGPNRNSESNDPQTTRLYLQNELNDIGSQIRLSGHRMLFMQPIPKFITHDDKVMFDHSKCMAISVLNGSCPKAVSMTLAYENNRQLDARTAIASTAKTTNSELLDLWPFFCPKSICSNTNSNGNLYRDAGHLTVAASVELGDIFTSALRKMILEQ